MGELIKETDYSGNQGGRKPIDLLKKVKMLFVQYLYNLSDLELEDQLYDRLSFQHFCGARPFREHTSLHNVVAIQGAID